MALGAAAFVAVQQRIHSQVSLVCSCACGVHRVPCTSSTLKCAGFFLKCSHLSWDTWAESPTQLTLNSQAWGLGESGEFCFIGWYCSYSLKKKNPTLRMSLKFSAHCFCRKQRLQKNWGRGVEIKCRSQKATRQHPFIQSHIPSSKINNAPK